jgi:Flp pilus assembly protein TadD
MFDSLARVRALPAQPGVTALALTSLAEARGYTREELLALAEIGYHYLFSGGHRIALTIFEGLSVIAPAEAYFTLALGLCYDRLDRLLDARRAYARASELDPQDPRPEINLAELEIEQNELPAATQRLARAVKLAKRRGEAALAAKAATLLARIAPRKGR